MDTRIHDCNVWEKIMEENLRFTERIGAVTKSAFWHLTKVAKLRDYVLSKIYRSSFMPLFLIELTLLAWLKRLQDIYS